MPTNLGASSALNVPHQYPNYSMKIHKTKKEVRFNNSQTCIRVYFVVYATPMNILITKTC